MGGKPRTSEGDGVERDHPLETVSEGNAVERRAGGGSEQVTIASERPDRRPVRVRLSVDDADDSVVIERCQDVIGRFARYDYRTDFERRHERTLANLVPTTEDYVFGIDCADRWLSRKRRTRLVLTEERVAAFRAGPSDPIKRTHWLEDITAMKYDTGFLTNELRLTGEDFYAAYTVPKRLGREFAEAVKNTLARAGSIRGDGSAETPT